MTEEKIKCIKLKSEDSSLMLRQIMKDLDISHLDCIKLLTQTGILLFGIAKKKFTDEEIRSFFFEMPDQVTEMYEMGITLLLSINEEIIKRSNISQDELR